MARQGRPGKAPADGSSRGSRSPGGCACGYAAFSLMPDNAAVLTVEYKINVPRPANAERYRASATVTKPGRTLTVSQGTVAPADGGDAIAVMTGTLITRRAGCQTAGL